MSDMHAFLAERDDKRAEWKQRQSLDELRSAIEALPEHEMSGYECEWECPHVQAAYDAAPGPVTGYIDAVREARDHPDHNDELVSRRAVLALIERLSGR